MSGKLCILDCANFNPEISAAVAAEGWQDVVVATYPARCGEPPLDWNELRALIPRDCSQVLILGRACLKDLDHPPAGWPPVRRVLLDECFELVAGATLVNEAIAHGSYLVTPVWLEDWRGRLQEMGFQGGDAADFFHDFARGVLLLDTGIVPDAAAKLDEFAAAVQLPATRIAVGLDYARLVLARFVGEWRLAEEQFHAREHELENARRLADYVSAVDFLGKLALLESEPEAIRAIQQMFTMLFAPQALYYVRFDKGAPQFEGSALPPALQAEVRALDRPWAWTAAGSGFLLRLTWTGEPLAVVILDHFAFPAFRERYLNLGLSIAGVCGLAIENARTYGRVKDAEAELRKSEFSLKMAQSIARLGHWEWDMHTGEMQWSDETYRILGYEPQRITPSRNSLLESVHPEDRAMVEEQIGQIGERGGCDMEYRIVLPNSQVRAVHCMVEVVSPGAGRKPTVIGTLRDITPEPGTEYIGIVQDITERKELETKLAQEARTDPLTGCANRRYFIELAEHHLAQVHRYGGDMSLLMLDLDHFKKINDEHGHQAGDLALQKLVEVCRAALRAVDIIGRLGGEEFAVLLPETGSDRATEVAERMRHAVAAAEVPLGSKPPLHFTVSIGAATLMPGENYSMAIGRADQALYAAKNAGRNRVVTA